MKEASWLIAALAGTFIVGCAPDVTVDEESDRAAVRSELVGAPLDPNHRFAVGLCTGPLQADGSCPTSGAGTSRCSATLIAPNLVLTARHCVERMAQDPTKDCGARFTGELINPVMQVTTNSSVLRPGSTWHAVESVQGPPDANSCRDDIALLTLATKVKDVAPAGVDLVTNVVDDPPPALAIVGRGAFHVRYDPATGARIEYDNGGLERRKLENIPVVCAPETVGECSIENHFFFSGTEVVQPGLMAHGRSTASGDSGSGVYAQPAFTKGRYLVMATHTLGAIDAEGNMSGGSAVLLQPHAAFIKAIARTAAQKGHYPLPFWAR